MTVRLDKQQLADLSDALDMLNRLTLTTGVRVGVHTGLNIGWDSCYLNVRWDDETTTYIVEDKVGW